MHLLHEVDPTNPETDTEEMLKLEREVDRMGPLIDAELERVDRKHAQLTQLSADLVEALGLYHSLMREQPQLPYSFNQMPQPPHSVPQPSHGMAPPTSMVPANYNGLPPQSQGMMPPGMGPPNMHYATLPMMPPPGMPPYMMHQLPDDRR